MGSSNGHPGRCRACRFWAAEGEECRRRAPVPRDEAGGGLTTVGIWPRTSPEGWCGEWESITDTRSAPAAATPAAPTTQTIAAELFLSRLAPGLETADPAAQVGHLLDVLPPDARAVVTRMYGLDGRPVTGLKSLAKEIGMSRDRVQALASAAEQRLHDALALVVLRQQRNRDSVS